MFDLPAKALRVRDQVEAFFDARILPNHALWQQQAAEGNPSRTLKRRYEPKLNPSDCGIWHCRDWLMMSQD